MLSSFRNLAMNRIILLLLFTSLALQGLGQQADTKANYELAFDELHQMLQGNAPLSFKRAVFVSENAYLDNQLSYENFSKAINGLVNLSKAVASEDGLNYDLKDRQQVLLAASIFRVMKEPLVFLYPDTNQNFRKNPYTYDMEDFWGERDWTKMFVGKLLNTQTGNCHSFPALYKILADELGVDAWLAITPNHTYIKQWSDKTGWYNTELTNGRFPIDADIKINSYIKTEAIASGVYMDTLSTKENIAYVINDLVQGYLKKFGYQDISTLISWLESALQYYPDFPNALILKAELQKKQYEQLMNEKGATHFSKLWKDPSMKNKFAELEQSYYQIHQLGYRRMPKEMYLNWLYRVNKDTTRRPYHFASPQPFKQFNYNVQVVTAGDGTNYEFFDQDTIARIGTIEFNVHSGKIVKFIQYNEDEIPDDVISRMYDPALGRWWQIDPLAHQFYSETPYNFVHNSPLNYVDPDGRAPLTDYYNLQGNNVKHVEDGKTDKVLVLTTSKNSETVDAAINSGSTMMVPSNEVVGKMEQAYKNTETTGNEHGFIVGEGGKSSKIVEGKAGEITSEWGDARKDLNAQGDAQAYDVHTHPKGTEEKYGAAYPSSTDMAPENNELNIQNNVVLGYGPKITPPPSNTIGGTATVTLERQIGVYNTGGRVHDTDIKFSDFSRAVRKINK